MNEFDVFTINRLIFLIKKHRIQILIPTKRKDYALAGFASRICGIKNVIRLGIVRSLRRNWDYRLVYDKLCDGCIVNAIRTRDALLESGFIQSDKIRVVYNGIDEVEIVRKSKGDVPFDSAYAFNVASMGELSHRKGLDVLLQGFAEFAIGRDCGLLLIGDGPEKKNLKILADELNISDQVSFLGFQTNPYPHLRQCDVFVMTSRNEGLSNALMEAMVLNRPVLSTRAGDIEEILEHGKNGYLIPQDDPMELACLLAELVEDDGLRRRIGQAGRKTVLNQFSMERMKSQLVDYFSEVLDA